MKLINKNWKWSYHQIRVKGFPDILMRQTIYRHISGRSFDEVRGIINNGVESWDMMSTSWACADTYLDTPYV